MRLLAILLFWGFVVSHVVQLYLLIRLSGQLSLQQQRLHAVEALLTKWAPATVTGALARRESDSLSGGPL